MPTKTVTQAETQTAQPSQALDYLESYRSRSTVTNYRRSLTRFFRAIGTGSEDLGQAADAYLARVGQDRKAVEKDLETFLASSKDAAPKTLALLLSSVKMFLMENDVELPEKFWRRLRRRMKGTRAITQFQVPSPAELRKILTHMDSKRALFLMMASSGMRIGEALALKLGNVELVDSDGKPKEPVVVRINASTTKTGNSRIGFISGEATEALQEWLKVREKYLKGAAGRSHIHEKNLEDDRVFPFEPGVAYSIWNKALGKAGLLKKDPNSGNHTMTPHCLRKFARTRMGTMIEQDVVEALIGHEAYLTQVYRKHSEADLAAFYRKAESALLIFHAGEEVSKLRKDVEEKNQQLQTIINGVLTENMELKSRLGKQEAEINHFVAEFNRVKGLMEKNMKANDRLTEMLKDTMSKSVQRIDRLSKLEQRIDDIKRNPSRKPGP